MKKIILVALVLAAIVQAKWLFAPSYGNNIPGVEKLSSNGLKAGAVPAPLAEFLKAAKADVKAKPKLSETQIKAMCWHVAAFPHRDFVKMMPQGNVFGWYAHAFDMPLALQGLDVVLDLGVIDDADETYLNAQLVGTTGNFPKGSAWNAPRVYRIPAELLHEKGNVVASHVFSMNGFGGIVGPAVLKAALFHKDAKWDVAFPKNVKNGLNQATDWNQVVALTTPVDDELDWKPAPMPWQGWHDWKADDHYVLFQAEFAFRNQFGTAREILQPIVLDIGPVYDVAAVYLNGRRIGQTGRFPEAGRDAFMEAASRGRYLVMPGDWSQTGVNHLAVAVYRERGVGGMPGLPGVLVDKALEGGFETADILLQSGQMKAAEEELAKIVPQDDTEQVRLLSAQAKMLYLKRLDGDNSWKNLKAFLRTVQTMVVTYPNESPRQSAMQAFCQVLREAETHNGMLKVVQGVFPKFNVSCQYLGEDRETGGDWPLIYGQEAYILAGMAQNGDVTGGITAEEYRRTTPGNRTKPTMWMDRAAGNATAHSSLIRRNEFIGKLSETPDWPQDLLFGKSLLAKAPIRGAAWWDDGGNMHPADDAGPNLEIQLRKPLENAQVTVYCQDADWKKTRLPRQQSIVVYSPDGALLNAAWIGKTDNGVHERFAVFGQGGVNVRVNKHRSTSVTVSGVFIDQVPQAAAEAKSVYQDPQVNLYGMVKPETQRWFGRMMAATGAKRHELAKQYRQYSEDLLSPSAGNVGAVMFILAAENAFDAKAALPVFKTWIEFNAPPPEMLIDLLWSLTRIQHLSSCWTYTTGAASLVCLTPELPRELRGGMLLKLSRICLEHGDLQPIVKMCQKQLAENK